MSGEEPYRWWLEELDRVGGRHREEEEEEKKSNRLFIDGKDTGEGGGMRKKKTPG